MEVMMPEEPTPEERLLKLIRRKDTAAGGIALAKKGSLTPFGPFLKMFSIDVFSFLEKLLMLACVVLTVLIAYEFVFDKKDVREVLQQKQSGTEEIFHGVAISQPKPYAVYQEQVAKRDIFQSPLFQGAKTDNTNPSLAVSSVPELTKNLKLVGIILDKISEAIIEDVDAGQTFFLKKGEQIRGATVDDIKENTVILLYKDERVELVQ